MPEAKRRLEANEKTVFLIGGAKDVPYDEIIKALNLLHSAGVKIGRLDDQTYFNRFQVGASARGVRWRVSLAVGAQHRGYRRTVFGNR